MSLIRFKNTAIPSLVEDFFLRENSELFEPFNSKVIPPVNILENENNFEIHLVAPGLKKENFQINLHENVITVSFKESTEQVEQNGKFTRKEFKAGSFKRSFTLDHIIERDQISASYVDGILILNLPKKEEAKQKIDRLIEIQ